MHRRAYSASRKAPVMQAKGNSTKRKPERPLIVSFADCVGRGCDACPCEDRWVVPVYSQVALQKIARRAPLLRVFVVLGIVTGTLIWLTSQRHDQRADIRQSEFSSEGRVFYPTAEQWATLTVEPVQQRVFRSEHVTEGKIAVDEDRSTPIFSPYAGRVLKLFVKPGDTVTVGQPLFTVQATDMVQAQNDFISAATALNKARSALNLAQIIDKRQRLLYEGKAVPLKEVQNARAALDAAENDVRSAE